MCWHSISHLLAFPSGRHGERALDNKLEVEPCEGFRTVRETEALNTASPLLGSFCILFDFHTPLGLLDVALTVPILQLYKLGHY